MNECPDHQGTTVLNKNKRMRQMKQSECQQEGKSVSLRAPWRMVAGISEDLDGTRAFFGPLFASLCRLSLVCHSDSRQTAITRGFVGRWFHQK